MALYINKEVRFDVTKTTASQRSGFLYSETGQKTAFCDKH